MDRIDDLKEFIHRSNEFFKDQVLKAIDDDREKKRIAVNNWNNENRLFLRELQKIYLKTEKGKKASRRRGAIRQRRLRHLIEELTPEHLENIREFYVKCPQGYEVDHIIPISKGGKHSIENLQYLTMQENRKKSAKLDWKSST